MLKAATQQDQMYRDLELLNKQEDYWEKNGSKKRFKKSCHIMIEMIRQIPHKRILDVGCGNGEFTKQLAEIANEVVAIDVSSSELKRAIEKNKNNSNIRFHTTTLYDFHDEKPFDIIVCSEVLYYMLDRRKTFSKLQSLGNYLVTSNFIIAFPYISLRGFLYELALRRFPLKKHFTELNLKEGVLSIKSLRKL